MLVPFAAAVLATLGAAASHTTLGHELAVHVGLIAILSISGLVSWRVWLAGARLLDDTFRTDARQRATIDTAGDAIIVIDDHAIIQIFNRAAERMFGYSAVEMIGTSLERLMTEGGRRAHAAYLANHGVTAMVEAARLRTIHKGVRKRGDVFSFELIMTEWRDGERRMFTGVMRDVTERERTEDALRESHARFAALFEGIADPLFVFELAGDGGFVVEAMNRAAEEETGISRFALKDCSPDDLAAQDDPRALRRALLRCVDSASSLTEQIRLRSLAGPRSHRLVLSPMRDAAGEIRRVLATGRPLGAGVPADPLRSQNAA